MDDTYNRRILIADDHTEILTDYVRILSSINYTLITASQGKEVISLAEQAVNCGKPFALVFLDIRMPPGIDGIQVAKEIQKIDPDIGIVFIKDSYNIPYDEILARMGGTDKFFYLRKPLDPDDIKQIASVLTEKWNLHQAIKKKTEELKFAHATTIRALAELAELRDTDTGIHLKRVAQYSKLIARTLGKRKERKWCNYITEQYIEDIGESSVLHDIGKIGIPDTILLKPGKLTEAEFDLMKTHTTIGGDTLTKADKEVGVRSFLTLGKEIAYYHHEKFDGTGYPKGLKGEEIPLSARIVALADVYDALTSMRPYREAISHKRAFDIITKDMGDKHFDPVILETFYQNEPEFIKIKTLFKRCLE